MDKKRVHEMLECLTKAAEAEFSKGIEHIDTKEMGEVVDMIKDLADAEKNLYEKCYYEKILEEIEEEEEFDQHMLRQMIAEMGETEGRMGYDRWRTSKGRFARKGTGHETSMAEATGRRGYTPDWPLHRQYPDYADLGVYGYDDGHGRDNDGRTGSRSSTGGMQSGSTAGRMGYTPDDGRTHSARDGRHPYDEARRYFHETGSQEHKAMMEDKGREYVGEAISTMRDIYSEADPQLQERMKRELSALYREFGGK